MFEPPGSGKGSRMRMLLCGEEALGLKGAYEAALAAAGVPGELQVVSLWDEVCDQLQGQDGFAMLSGGASLAAYEEIAALGASSRLSGGVSLALSVQGRLLGLNLFGEAVAAALAETASAEILSGARVVLVGTDCRSCSCVSALAMAGADDVIMVSEDKERAAQVMTKLLEAYSQLAQSVAGIPSGTPGQRSFAEAYAEATFRYAGLGSLGALSAEAVATIDLRGGGCSIVLGGSQVPEVALSEPDASSEAFLSATGSAAEASDGPLAVPDATLSVAAHFVARQVQSALGIVGEMRDLGPDDLVGPARDALIVRR